MSYTIFRSLGHGEIPKDERSLAITSTHLDPHKADFDLLVAYYDAALDALSKGFAVVAFHLGRHMIELGLKLIIAWVREEPVPMEGGKGHDLEHLDSIAQWRTWAPRTCLSTSFEVSTYMIPPGKVVAMGKPAEDRGRSTSFVV